jgi:hypothetical protein
MLRVDAKDPIQCHDRLRFQHKVLTVAPLALILIVEILILKQGYFCLRLYVL